MAGLGVAVGSSSFSMLKEGMDQTAAAAELDGLLEVVKAADEVQRDVHILVDNRGVQKRFERLCKGGELESGCHAYARWEEVRRLAKKRMHTTSWVPSHGKQTNWSAGSEERTKRWRGLNAQADKAATQAIKREELRRKSKEDEARHAEAATKADQALRRLQNLSQCYRKKIEGLLPKVAEEEDEANDEGGFGSLNQAEELEEDLEEEARRREAVEEAQAEDRSLDSFFGDEV